ncbi:sugar phosphate nucleotidyltransferase [Ammoniphilus sp. CFH 90114]|uniref:sugar phosphate nucleotidyltransferase n=1 Tax=Ammoniphilus sp. CFH 90114 TaxID=2493665 RepID=UPI0013E95183|nr:sugar phosphate nucleotidyltransferase [Ammoniphilus sp. CFH 90114]
MRLIGIIPAAGLGSRLQPLPFSKELYPAGFQTVNGNLRVSPISLHLIKSLQQAKVNHVFFVINPQKTDIPRYYLNGKELGMNFSYLYQPKQKGMVDALAQVTSWIWGDDDTLLLFGMPDTYFQPPSLFEKMIEVMKNNQDLHVVLGVFPTSSWWKLGMVRFKEQENGIGHVLDIHDKPKVKPKTKFAWGTAVWRLSFQQYLTRCQDEYKGENELVLGDVFMRAKTDGMKIGCVVGKEYEDLGTLEDLMKFMKRMSKGQKGDQ